MGQALAGGAVSPVPASVHEAKAEGQGSADTLQLSGGRLHTAWLNQQLALHQGCCSDGCCSNCRLEPREGNVKGPPAPGLADNLLIQGLLLLLLLLLLLPVLVPILKAFRKRSVLI